MSLHRPSFTEVRAENGAFTQGAVLYLRKIVRKVRIYNEKTERITPGRHLLRRAPFWLREEGRIACGRNDFSRGSGNTGKRPRGNRKRNGNARSQ